MSRKNNYNICFTGTSKKQFDSLQSKIRQEIIKILEEEIARNPLKGKPLHGALKGLRSERIGSLRIIYQVIKMELVVMVISIDHRKKVYRKRK
ncbi:MAG: type II toxin-antitoxin system mRNA interferase toxin, RelE/StbE family [Elusimicrobia bacterium HGW-Elusimicrobia-2]|nr:MAG: type II toxin-antitoxin system mRNA interferase toxin, RelE/StbE family [Elusimicrobia bacterium HGW-Elusimicrobia-2]